MNKRNQIYDKLSSVLTEYEEMDLKKTTMDNLVAQNQIFYDLLIEIQNEWETVITAQEY